MRYFIFLSYLALIATSTCRTMEQKPSKTMEHGHPYIQAYASRGILYRGILYSEQMRRALQGLPDETYGSTDDESTEDEAEQAQQSQKLNPLKNDSKNKQNPKT